MIRNYNIAEISKMLQISTTAVCELKKKFGIDTVDDKGLIMLRALTIEIRNVEGQVTTATINNYIYEMSIQNFAERRSHND